MSETYEAAIEIREAINALTKEVQLLRLLLADVIDHSAGSFPGYVRTSDIGGKP